MRLLLLLLLAAASQARKLPVFEDEILGKLIVSLDKFPFLTPKHAPDMAYIYPTDQQLKKIKIAVGERVEIASRMRRALINEAPSSNGGDDNDDDGDFDDSFDTSAALKWFGHHQKFLGKFLKSQFSFDISNRTMFDTASIDSDPYFKAIVVGKEKLKSFLEDQFNPRMRTVATSEKPWLPAEKVIQEMKECAFLNYGSASDEDFKYDTENGGSMVYYKVTCMKVKDSYYIGLSMYENKFTLPDVERVEKVVDAESETSDETETEDESSLKRSDLKRMFASDSEETKEYRWFEKSSLKLSDLKQLLDFIMRDFAGRIRMEYGQYLETVKTPVPQ